MGFYAIGNLDVLELHLKEAPKNAAEGQHRSDNEHLDASAGVEGIEAFLPALRWTSFGTPSIATATRHLPQTGSRGFG